jgi:deoxyribose-phosphate aldolase
MTWTWRFLSSSPPPCRRPTLDSDALRAWTAAVKAWTPTAQLAPELQPRAFGLVRPGPPVLQPPWGLAAADALRTAAGLTPYLDHTLLRPEALSEDVRRLAEEARAHGFAAACVQPLHVRTLVVALGSAPVTPVSVVGFPHGAHRSPVKALEAQLAVADGARELDVVASLGALVAFDVEAALEDMLAVVEAARPWPVKLILETGLLDRRSVVLGAGLALLAGCAFVKTSTGFGPPGARPEDVALLRSVVGVELGVKASGGIRSKEQARALVLAGASRLGTSASVALVATEEPGPPFTAGH